MEAVDLQAVVSSSNPCTSNATVVMNSNVLPLFQLTSLSDDSDKGDFCPEKFGTSLISGTEIEDGPRVLQCQIVDTSRGLVQVVTDNINNINVGHLTLNSLTNGGHVTLNGLSQTDLQQTTLLTSSDSFTHTGAPLFEVQTETVADQSELTIACPMLISGGISNLSIGTAPGTITAPSGTYGSIQNKQAPKRRGGWPKGKKRKKEKESLAPKAPATAYVIFAMERRMAIKETNPEVMFVEVTKILGNEWSTMSQEEKQKYLDAAEADKKRYMEELKVYQHSDAYQNFLKRKKLKPIGSDDDSTGADGQFSDSNAILNELEEEGLYCKVCNQYFSSLHNRKEHMFGKQHLQAITSEFEKELQGAPDVLNPDLSHEVLTSESDHSLASHSFVSSPSPLDITSFMQEFIGKNQEREQEIRELKETVEIAQQQNAEIVNKCRQYKELETKLEQEVDNLKAYQAALIAQIDGLRMVPMLFDVINFYIDPKEEES